MAVYTTVEEEEMKDFVSLYDLGEYHSHVGIQAGVSNSNFILRTDRGKFIVTLFEPHRVREEDVSFFLSYVEHLKQENVGCPKTFRTKSGEQYTIFKERPASIFEFMRGTCGDIAVHTPKICFEGGALLGQMHKASESFKQTSPNLFGIEKWQQWAKDLCPKADVFKEGLCSIVQSEMAFLNDNWPKDLPSGAIHGDYFDDNVFYDGENAVGVIDFHFVCTDFYAFDLAIAINAWCFNAFNHLEEDRYQNFMKGYESVRPLSEEEKEAFPVLLRGGSMRFLLSRMEEGLQYTEGDFMVPHDPLVFLDKLNCFQKQLLKAA